MACSGFASRVSRSAGDKNSPLQGAGRGAQSCDLAIVGCNNCVRHASERTHPLGPCAVQDDFEVGVVPAGAEASGGQPELVRAVLPQRRRGDLADRGEVAFSDESEWRAVVRVPGEASAQRSTRNGPATRCKCWCARRAMVTLPSRPRQSRHGRDSLLRLATATGEVRVTVAVKGRGPITLLGRANRWLWNVGPTGSPN
jgi:hypothetical protein